MPPGRKRRVYADIVGDLFHHGHVNLLRRARALGDVLVVGVCSDELVASYKRAPVMTLEERVAVVSGCRYADEVVPDCPCPVTEAFLREHDIDLVVHGDDFSDEQLRRWYAVPMKMGILRKLPYTPEISTTDLIRRILDPGRADP
jgi:cytidyltransferase-like protein